METEILSRRFELFTEKIIQLTQPENKNIIIDNLKKTVDYIQNFYIKNAIPDFDSYIQKSYDIAVIISEKTIAGINTVSASVLYNSISRKVINDKEIAEYFSVQTSSIISGLHKLPELKSGNFSKDTENFIKLLLTISGDVRALIIRLAVQVYLMRNIDNQQESERKIIAAQTGKLFAPLAHRLGLYNIKTELEETAMRYTNSDMYVFIAKKLSDTKENRELYIKNFIVPLEKDLKKAGFNCTIKGRPKSIFSIWKKMQKQGVPFEEVYDLFAIRIIIDCPLEKEKELCWKAYSIVTDSYNSNPKRMRDWISSPKNTAYESLHATVVGPENKWVEVQIRTERMDEIAEKGFAAHWRYKDGDKGENSQWLAKMRESIENPDFDNDNNENSRNKSELYSHEIFIFTPAGDLKKMKPGDTILDFAYQIHSNIGNTCTGATVNDVLKPISYELKNGEIVKIHTSKTAKPKQEWIKFANSKRTVAKIKSALKDGIYEYSKAGKEIIKEKLAQLKLDFVDSNIEILRNYFGFDTPIKMYQAFGENKIDILKVKTAFEKKIEVKEVQTKELKEVYTLENTPNYGDLIIESGISNLNYDFAKCCSPKLGDEVFGFVSVSKGIKIHKNDCSNAPDMKIKYPYRIIKAGWHTSDDESDFISTINLTGKDRLGITAAITKIISEEFRLNIKAISVSEGKENKFYATIVVDMKGRKMLNSLLARLKKVKDIISVSEKVSVEK